MVSFSLMEKGHLFQLCYNLKSSGIIDVEVEANRENMTLMIFMEKLFEFKMVHS